MTVYDIPSVQHSGQSAGSVSFSQSFLHSAIASRSPDGGEELDGVACVLTGHIPTHVSWPVSIDIYCGHFGLTSP